MSEHTKEPWFWLPDEGQFIVTADRAIVAEVPCQGANPEDGRRIVACVNACEGILTDDLARLMAENERHEELFEQIDKWAEAYPTDLWPEVAKEDWPRINKALTAAGWSLSRISASNMRHVITRIKEQADIARAALKGELK